MNDWTDAAQLAGQAADLMESGRLPEAESALRRALAIDSEQPDWHHQLGALLVASDRHAEAIVAFDAASRLEPTSTEHIEAAVDACFDLRDHRGAESRLQILTKRAPDDDRLWARLIGVQADAGRHDEAEATYYLAGLSVDRSVPCLLALCESLMARELWKKAAWCIDEALEIEPTCGWAFQLSAEIQAATGDLDGALKTYEELIGQSPIDANVAVSYSGLLRRAGRDQEAAAILQQVLNQHPVHAEAHYQLGRMALESGAFHQAALAFQLVRRLDRTHELCDRSLAEALLELGQVGDARRLLALAAKRAAKARAHEDSAALVAFGQLLLRGGLPQEAADAFHEVARRSSWNDVDLLRLLAQARFRSGDIQGGRVASRRVLRWCPQCVASHSNLALASLRSGRYREAAAWIRRGLQQHPDDAVLRQLRFKLALRVASKACKRLLGLKEMA